MTIKPNLKAIEIAKDVLANLDGLNVRRGSFLRPREVYEADKTASKYMRLKRYVSRLVFAKKECKVCALGAIYLSSFNLPEFKGQSPANITGSETDRNVIECAKSIFGTDAAEIETAFELGAGWGAGRLGYQAIQNAGRFGQRFHDAKLRLRAIMQNVIDNDGNFIPGVDGSNAEKYVALYGSGISD